MDQVAPRQVADTMWYFPLLKPYVDHVPVKADLSDLEEKIRWCRANDDACRKIAENAMKFYNTYVGRSALLDYVEMVCKSISCRFVQPPGKCCYGLGCVLCYWYRTHLLKINVLLSPEWWTPPPKEQQVPHLRRPDMPCHTDRESGRSRLCVRCQQAAELEERELKEMQEKEKDSQKGKTEKKRNIRKRMIEKASTQPVKHLKS